MLVGLEKYKFQYAHHTNSTMPIDYDLMRDEKRRKQTPVVSVITREHGGFYGRLGLRSVVMF